MWLINVACSFAFLTFRLNYGWEKHGRRAEKKGKGKNNRERQRERRRNKTEEQRKVERERLRGMRKNSSEEQRYGGDVQPLQPKEKRKEITERDRQHLLMEKRI